MSHKSEDIEAQVKCGNEDTVSVTKPLNGDAPLKKQPSTNDVQCMHSLLLPFQTFKVIMVQHKKKLKALLYVLLVLMYIAYFIAALFVSSLSSVMPLVILTSSVFVVILHELFTHKLITYVKSFFSPTNLIFIVRWSTILIYVLVAAFLLWLIIDIIMKNPKNLISAVGYFVIVMICVIVSNNPDKINWRQVLNGTVIQLVLGLLVLRTQFGFEVFRFLGNQISQFMSYSNEGAKFVFGDQYTMHFFAFKILPIIVFFSTVSNMLFYIGAMQWLISKLSFFVSLTLGVSTIESVVAIANIFVGMTEAPLVIRPYLDDITPAELHSVLTAGLGSIAFSVYGAYVDMGIDAVHLLTACVMSAPASLILSRILFPETKTSKFMKAKSLAMTSGTENNMVEAAAVGASTSIGLVANIAANLIGFIALLKFLNSTLQWFGNFIKINLSFDVICGYLFTPVAFLLGADWQDCFTVGKLFGIKTFLNEFIGYSDLVKYIDTGSMAGNATAFISKRSEIVATHALCGFCNVSSLGIVVGGLSVLMPNRIGEIAKLALRALFGGIMTCCMTACVAGLLFQETVDEILDVTKNTTSF